MARDYGYKIQNILSCIQFDKDEGTFKDYIYDIFNLKKDADLNKNKVERYIYKLLLNALFGRLGLKQQQFKLSLVPDKRLSKLKHNENFDILFSSNNLNLIKSSGPIDPDIEQIIQSENLYETKYNSLNAANP